MPTFIATETVTLRAGHVVSLDALRLLWALEDAGLTLHRHGDQIAVGPKSKVKDEHHNAIRQYRDELLALIDYTEMTTVFDGMM